MKSFYLTDAGKVRNHNEDSVIILKNKNDEYLLAVADGLGGHSAGEVASSTAISYLGKKFKEQFLNYDKNMAIKFLKDSVVEINNLIFKYVEDHPESKGMGTTLVVSIVTKEYILFGNIGDSSGYVVKNNVLHKVTYDHNLVNLLLSAGEITEEEAKNHPKKNILMKALGPNNPVEMDIFDCDNKVNIVFLASDGLTNMVSDKKIEKILLDDDEIEDKLISMVKRANSAGGTDNISVACLIRDTGDLDD